MTERLENEDIRVDHVHLHKFLKTLVTLLRWCP